MKRNILLNTLYIVFLTLVILSFMFMILGSGKRKVDYSFDDDSYSTFNEGWLIEEGNSDGIVMDLPVKLGSNYNEVITISNTLPEDVSNHNCLMIESLRQEILVYIDGELRTEYTDQGQRISNSLPYSYLVISLHDSDCGKEVKMVIQSDTFYSGTISDVIIGDEMSVILMLIKTNILWLGLVFGTALVGIVCLVCFVIYRKTFELITQFLYLFWFALFSTFWCFMQLKIRQVFIKDVPLFESGAHCSFLLIAIPIILIINLSTEYRYSKFYMSLLVVTMVNFLTQNTLHTTIGIDYFSMQNITQLLILAILLISIVLMARVLIAEGRNVFVETCLIGTIGYTLSILCEAAAIGIGLNSMTGRCFILGTYFFITANLIGVFICNNEEQQKKKDAESANIAKSRFLATMSHEIRTPVNVMLGMNEMIIRDTNEENTKEYANNITEAGNHLLAIINDILDVSKIESGKMDIVNSDYDLKPLLNEIIRAARTRIGEKGIALNISVDESIPAKYHGDEVRIRQVLTNILTNAAKYTEKGSITFTVKNAGIDGNYINLYFSIKDTGIGIKEKDLDLLLDSTFVRVDEVRNKNIEGTGLGLSITRYLLELMGTKLEVDSIYGEGSDFHFTIRQKIVDKTPIGTLDGSAKVSEKKRRHTFTAPDVKILAVDDTRPNLLVIRGLLKPYHSEVDIVMSGKECLELCENKKYDLILMDHMMPEMDGIETFKLLRNGSSPNKDTKVIVLTANAMAGIEKKYEADGFDGYLAKPIDVVKLDECLKNTIDDSKIIML